MADEALTIGPEPITSTLQDVILNNRQKSTLYGLTRSAAAARRLPSPTHPAHHPASIVAKPASTMQESNPFSPDKLARPLVMKESSGNDSANSLASTNSSASSFNQLITALRPSPKLRNDHDGV